MKSLDPVEVLQGIIRLGPNDAGGVGFPSTGLEHLGEFIEIGNLVTAAGLPLEAAGVTAVAAPPGLNLPFKLQASFGASVSGVALADHEREANVAQVFAPRFARG